MNKIFVLLASIGVLTMTAGCHAQLPPSPAPTVVLTWTASTSCTGSSATCTYVVSRATVSSGSCPATTGTAYTPLNQASPVSGTTFTDSAPTVSVCYVAQTIQSSLVSQASSASNSGTPLTVPVVPLAPSAPNATATADLVVPQISPSSATELAKADLTAPMQITAKLSR